MWWRRKQEEEASVESLEPVAMEPIGVVRNGVKDPQPDGWDSVTSRIVLRDSLVEQLDGIEGYSHILVLFWIHKVSPERRATTKLHPRGREDLPLLGVFATRTQYRPNPIGATVVPLLERRGTTLTVLGLDAIDGTPVLDLKPYLPYHDSVPDARMPDWVHKV
ncbi:MAG: tRNA (N6-threonylcarbamoyladenosine(37)-N6)-methyltransferase TrmO [Chloroflexi bacterium]|nr:tRNA (N6-threonylcarbamoyladenosine(37)-N6)-methyltransferase TrmO [Chloroflexota bacterium]